MQKSELRSVQIARGFLKISNCPSTQFAELSWPHKVNNEKTTRLGGFSPVTRTGNMHIPSFVNQGEALHIINSAGIVYHQHAVLYIIKPKENTR